MTNSERRKQVRNGIKSASALGNMRRDWWGRTPLLVLVLIACLAGNAVCETGEDESLDEVTTEASDAEKPVYDSDAGSDPSEVPEATVTPSTLSSETTLDEGQGSGDQIIQERGTIVEGEPTDSSEDEEGLSPIIILVPVVLAVVIIIFIVAGIMIHRRLNGKMSDSENGKDPYLDDHSSEKVPMPMFEEDVPSVLELEMEDLEQWINKDGTSFLSNKVGLEQPLGQCDHLYGIRVTGTANSLSPCLPLQPETSEVI